MSEIQAQTVEVLDFDAPEEPAPAAGTTAPESSAEPGVDQDNNQVEAEEEEEEEDSPRGGAGRGRGRGRARRGRPRVCFLIIYTSAQEAYQAVSRANLMSLTRRKPECVSSHSQRVKPCVL